jgi:hypothetical protein
MKNSNDIIGNLSRDLPVCSAVSERLRHFHEILYFILNAYMRSASHVGRYQRERAHGMLWYALDKRLSRSQSRAGTRLRKEKSHHADNRCLIVLSIT